MNFLDPVALRKKNWGRNFPKYKSQVTENKKKLKIIGFFSGLEQRKAMSFLQNERGHEPFSDYETKWQTMIYTHTLKIFPKTW